MGRPFARYASLRLLWHKPTVLITNLREGIRPTTQSIVIEAYISKLERSSSEQDLGGRSIGQSTISGYITRWALLPNASNWLQAGTSWGWNTSGLRPDGLLRGEKLEAFHGDLSSLPLLDNGEKGWLTIDGMSSVGGIDAIIRAKAGDKFSGLFIAGR